MVEMATDTSGFGFPVIGVTGKEIAVTGDTLRIGHTTPGIVTFLTLGIHARMAADQQPALERRRPLDAIRDGCKAQDRENAAENDESNEIRTPSTCRDAACPVSIVVSVNSTAQR